MVTSFLLLAGVLKRPISRLRQNVVISLVAIPPTNLEAADTTNRFRFENPVRHVARD